MCVLFYTHVCFLLYAFADAVPHVRFCRQRQRCARTLTSRTCCPLVSPSIMQVRPGLVRTIYIRCVYGVFGREITEYTVIYAVHIYGSGQP